MAHLALLGTNAKDLPEEALTQVAQVRVTVCVAGIISHCSWLSCVLADILLFHSATAHSAANARMACLAAVAVLSRMPCVCRRAVCRSASRCCSV